MRNLKTYYSASVKEFLNHSDNYILGVIHSNDISAETTIQQNNTWSQEIQILKEQLKSFAEGRILFEYTIPRMGKRVDAVLLYKNIVFCLSLSVGMANIAVLHTTKYTIMLLIYVIFKKKVIINYLFQL